MSLVIEANPYLRARTKFRDSFSKGVKPVDRREPIPDELALAMIQELDVPKDAVIGVFDAFLILSTHLKEQGYTNIVLLENDHRSLTSLQEQYYNKVKTVCEKSGIRYYVPPMNNYNRRDMKFDVIIGNPPYGNAGRQALQFLNKIAELELSNDIRLVMPRSIRKASLLNSVNRHIHIVEDITNDDMLFGRKIKTVTQRYELREEFRELIPQPKKHPDFQFLKKGDPDVNVFIMRSGAAGKVLTEDYDEYEQSHYFIHANNEQVIDNLKSISEELIELGEETTGMNKVSIPEIITTYTEHYG